MDSAFLASLIFDIYYYVLCIMYIIMYTITVGVNTFLYKGKTDL